MDLISDCDERQLADCSFLDISVTTTTVGDIADTLNGSDGDIFYDSDKDPAINPNTLDSSDTTDGEAVPSAKEPTITRSCAKWANSKRKWQRNSGEQYTTKSGKTVNRRIIKEREC